MERGELGTAQSDGATHRRLTDARTRSLAPRPPLVLNPDGNAVRHHHDAQAAKIAMMKPGAMLLNVSRGGLIDTSERCLRVFDRVLPCLPGPFGGASPLLGCSLSRACQAARSCASFKQTQSQLTPQSQLRNQKQSQSDALLDGVRSGRVGAVGLDVYEREAEMFFRVRHDGDDGGVIMECVGGVRWRLMYCR